MDENDWDLTTVNDFPGMLPCLDPLRFVLVLGEDPVLIASLILDQNDFIRPPTAFDQSSGRRSTKGSRRHESFADGTTTLLSRTIGRNHRVRRERAVYRYPSNARYARRIHFR